MRFQFNKIKSLKPLKAMLTTLTRHKRKNQYTYKEFNLNLRFNVFILNKISIQNHLI